MGNKFLHTPGPWHPDKNTPGDINGPDGKDVGVALFYGMSEVEITGREETLADISREEAFANARLMAAAPDLLDACRLALSAIRGLAPGEPDYLIRAIAKAAQT